MIKDFTHPTLGNISIVYNRNARRVIMRVKSGHLVVTVPLLLSKKELMDVLADHEAKLREKLARKPVRLFDDTTSMEGDLFSMEIERSPQSVFRMSLKEGRLKITCPQEVDFAADTTQQLLASAVLKALKLEAKSVLKARVRILAQQNRIAIGEVKTNSSVGRWGSCNNRGNINLSCYCLLLPAHLLDYVILHELSHTFEMNHSERFYAKLDQLCGGNNSLYYHELKHHTSPVLELLRQFR